MKIRHQPLASLPLFDKFNMGSDHGKLDNNPERYFGSSSPRGFYIKYGKTIAVLSDRVGRQPSNGNNVNNNHHNEDVLKGLKAAAYIANALSNSKDKKNRSQKNSMETSILSRCGHRLSAITDG